MIILLVAAPQTFIGICKQIFHTFSPIRKYHKCLEINSVWFILPQFYSMKAMSQSPCFDIEYSGSYRPFLSRKSKWSKIQNIYCNFSNFYYNNIPLRWLSTVWSSGDFDHSCGIVYELQPKYFVAEIHHRRLHLFFWTFSFDTVVTHFVPGNLKTLKKRLFFIIFSVFQPMLLMTIICN